MTAATELLPKPAEIKVAIDTLYDAEEATDDLAQRVFRAINADDAPDVTCEHIAELVAFVTELKNIGGWITARAEKLSEAVTEDLNSIRRDGEKMSVPRLNAYGTRNYKPEGGLTRRAEVEYFKPIEQVGA